jgi:hypothetical protein
LVLFRGDRGDVSDAIIELIARAGCRAEHVVGIAGVEAVLAAVRPAAVVCGPEVAEDGLLEVVTRLAARDLDVPCIWVSATGPVPGPFFPVSMIRLAGVLARLTAA